MTLRGESAGRVVVFLVGAVVDLLPSGVALAAWGKHNSNIKATLAGPSETSALGRDTPLGGLHVEGAVLGFGTWVPFVPRRVAMRLAVADVLETIQHSVASVTGTDWPARGATIVSENREHGVWVAFADKNGEEIAGYLVPTD